jgi:hypothetical protein
MTNIVHILLSVKNYFSLKYLELQTSMRHKSARLHETHRG